MESAPFFHPHYPQAGRFTGPKPRVPASFKETAPRCPRCAGRLALSGFMWISASRCGRSAAAVEHRKTLLNWGPWLTIPGGYAGAKIAFNRIPDAEDF